MLKEVSLKMGNAYRVLPNWAIPTHYGPNEVSPIKSTSSEEQNPKIQPIYISVGLGPCIGWGHFWCNDPKKQK